MANKLDVFPLSPVPQIAWRRSDGLSFPNKITLRKFNAVLEIANFQQEDTGSYECIAENSRGKNVARGRLTYYGEYSGLVTVALVCETLPLLLLLQSVGNEHTATVFNRSLLLFLKRGKPYQENDKTRS